MPTFDEDYPAFLYFEPRPDQPERYDQQTSFVEDQCTGVAFSVGGTGAGTTSSAMHKVAEFLMDTPPPRADTPFWIISDSYEVVCETCWKEKLHGMQFIDPDEIDWERIAWRNRNKDWPNVVPLRSWPGEPGRNWSIEFKSYKQGRKQFQARSIGGFCFVEQFPWKLLEEVHARCREYNFPGSKIAEFTPIDPDLSLRLQVMQEEGTLPPGWQVYRANTGCAMEAGHIDADWYDQFFMSMTPEDRAVREIGAWASHEGQIYPTFNPLVHLIKDDEVFPNEGTFPVGVFHRRAIDWGFSAEHAFVCLWGYYYPDSHSWVIYDEYWNNSQKLTVVEHLASISKISESWGWDTANPHFGQTYADPSRPDHFRISSRLSEYPVPDASEPSGMKTYPPIMLQPALNSVYEGIDHVRSQLSSLVTTGKPRLLISKSACPNLARQMQTYRWVVGNDAGANPRAGRQEPLKRDDDAVDALRYLLYSDAKRAGVSIQQIAVKHAGVVRRATQFVRGGRGA